MKRNLCSWIGLILLAAVLTMAACGDDDPVTPASEPTPTETPSEAPTAVPTPERLYDPGDGTIVVAEPLPGAEVFSPVSISGDADVFEANVSIAILGPNMEELVSTFATASCGTGCRGDFEKDVEFEVAHRQEGWIQVFESSAKDGSPQHIVLIPVVLNP